jgi:hypothetical protein
VVRISSLKFKVQHIMVRRISWQTHWWRASTPWPEISCHAVLGHFPLVFQDLAVLQRQDPELSAIIGKLQNKEPLPKYSLSKCVLYCSARFDHRRKVVVPSAAVAMPFFTAFTPLLWAGI